MATLKQIDANRRNAQKSTGPRTDAGRAAVRMNGLTHGLTAETLVLAGESQADFESLLASFEAEHEPATPTEVALVSQLTMAAWRLRRGYHAEASYFTKRLNDNDNIQPAYTSASSRIAIAFNLSAPNLDNFSRYEARLERSFYRALKELQRLRKQRSSEMENQSQFEDPPPAPEPDPAPITVAEESPEAAVEPVGSHPTPTTDNPPPTTHRLTFTMPTLYVKQRKTSNDFKEPMDPVE